MGSTAISSVNSEQLRIRNLQPPATPLPQIPSPFLSPLSTIKSASTKESIVSSRPTLPPSHNYTLEALHSCLDTEKVTTESAQLHRKQMETRKVFQNQLDDEAWEALKAEAAATRSSNTWSIVSDVSEYVLTLPLILSGSGVLAAGGAAVLVGRVIQDSGIAQAAAAWWSNSSETQQRIANVIETTTASLSLGLSIGGGIWAYKTGAFALVSRSAFMEKAKQILGFSGAALSTTSNLGKAFSQKHLGDARAKDITIDSERMNLQQQATLQNLDAKKAMENAVAFTKAASEIVKASEDILQQEDL